jgi:hypothetical protein
VLEISTPFTKVLTNLRFAFFLRENFMRSRSTLLIRIAVLAIILLVTSAPVFAQASGQTTFASAKQAEAGLIEALRNGDTAALIALLGPGSEPLISSGDNVADKKGRDHFVAAYDQNHTLSNSGAEQFTLNIGKDLWPLPIPLVKAGDKYYWDGSAGAQELIYRRIGRNELDAINVCKGVVAAQKDYAATSHDGHPAGAYAQRIVSESGTQNGLYWEVNSGDPPSPAGPMLASANAEGYDTTHRTPYHGYYYRMLKNGKGFGFLAYPADYRSSGVMTFQVSQTGVIYQKDLGEKTTNIAGQMTDYQVDKAWKVVQ